MATLLDLTLFRSRGPHASLINSRKGRQKSRKFIPARKKERPPHLVATAVLDSNQRMPTTPSRRAAKRALVAAAAAAARGAAAAIAARLAARIAAAKAAAATIAQLAAKIAERPAMAAGVAARIAARVAAGRLTAGGFAAGRFAASGLTARRLAAARLATTVTAEQAGVGFLAASKEQTGHGNQREQKLRVHRGNLLHVAVKG
jgi:hypothetical protein